MAKPRQPKANKSEKVEDDTEAMNVEVKKPAGRGRKPKEIVKDDVIDEEGPSKPKRVRKNEADETETKEETTKSSVVTKNKKKGAPNKQDVDNEELTDKKTTKDETIMIAGRKKQTVAQKNNNDSVHEEKEEEQKQEEEKEDEEEAVPKSKTRGVKKVTETKKPIAAVKGQKKIVKEKTPESNDGDNNDNEENEEKKEELVEKEIVTSQKIPAKRGRKAATPVAEIDNKEEEEKIVPSKRGRKAKESTIDTTEKEEVVKTIPAKRGKKIAAVTKNDDDGDDGDDDDDDANEIDSTEKEEIVKPVPLKRGRKPAAAAVTKIENGNANEVTVKPPGRRGRKPAAAAAVPVEEKTENNDDDNEEVEEQVVKKPASKRGKKVVVNETDDKKNGEEKKDIKITDKPASKKGKKPTPIAESTDENSTSSKEEVESEKKDTSNTNEQINKTNDTTENNDIIENKKEETVESIEKDTKESLIDEINSKIETTDNNIEKNDEKIEEIENEIKKTKRGGGRKAVTTKITKIKESNDNQDNDNNNDEKEKITKKNKTDTDLKSINFTCDKLNKKGDKYNIKICSWNVSGARAASKKQALAYFTAEDADIILLQEIKCTKDELIEVLNIPGYKLYTEGSLKGYSGVAFYTKKEPINVKYGLENYLNNESRLITAEYDNYYIVCSYHPNAGQKLKTIDKKMEWNKLFKDYIKELDSKKPVIVCGDLNVAHKEIDLKNPSTNSKSAGFTKEERDCMTDLLAAGFVDTYRLLYPDQVGAYTFWSYMGNARARNIGWRLDYYLTSKRIADNVCDNVIRNEVYGSDHCPVVLFINI